MVVEDHDLVEDDDSTISQLVDSFSPGEAQDDSEEIHLGDNIQMGVELMQLCSKAQVPLYFYDKLLRLFKKHSDVGTKVSTVPSCDRLTTHLKSKIPFIEPQSFPITSTDDIVPKFSFLDQLKDLFSTQYFENVDSCCVNVY